MSRCRCRAAALAVVLLTTGCHERNPSGPGQAPAAGPVTLGVGAGTAGGASDAGQGRSADVSILSVGNSHTAAHDLPALVCGMIRFRRPEKTVYAHHVPVGFLEDAARDPACRDEIESRPWKYVVLQAQKI